MGRIGINAYDVAQAIATIQGQRQNPTVDRIRTVLGTGSRSTISKLLREWKEKNQPLPIDKTGMPLELVNLVKNLWLSLQDQAQQELTTAKEILANESAQLQQALKEERQATAKLNKQRQTQEEQHALLIQQFQTTQTALSQTETEVQRLKERLKVMTEHQDQQETEQQRLHELIKHLQKNLEHYQASSQELRYQQTVLLDKQRQEYERKLLKLQTQLNEAQHQRQLTQQTLTSQKAQLAQAETTVHEITAVNQETQQTNHQLTTQYEWLSTQYQELKQAHEDNSHSVATLKEKLQVNQELDAKNQQALQEAQGRLGILQEDYLFLAQEKARLEAQVQLLSPKKQKVAEIS